LSLYAFLVFFIILSMVLYHIFALYMGSKMMKYILKPGTMVFIIMLALYSSPWDTTFGKWVVVALLLSVIGDVFLMLHEKWFVHGLVSFFIAHVFYIAAFWGSFSLDMTSSSSLIIGLLLLLIAVCFFLFLFPSVHQEGGGQLATAVALYIIVISVMFWSAILIGSSMLIFASLLFYVSDAVLAIDKFPYRFKVAEHIVMVTYFSAQLLFAVSISWGF